MNNGLSPKHNAWLGIMHLQEAVLGVLAAIYPSVKCIGAEEISRRAGIFRGRGEVNIINDAITHGVLVLLAIHGKVERGKQDGNNRGGWQLTEEEYEARSKPWIDG